MNKFQILSILLILLITSCTSEPPKCSDPKTIDLIKHIIVENIRTTERGGNALKEFTNDQLLSNIQIDSIRTNKKDKSVKKNFCDASIKIPAVIIEGDSDKLKAIKDEIGFDWFNLIYGNDFLEKKQSELKLDIQYASQLDDNSKHIVIIDNLNNDTFLKLSLKFYQNLTKSYLSPLSDKGNLAQSSSENNQNKQANSAVITSYVTDSTSTLAFGEKEILNDKLATFTEKYGSQIAVTIISSTKPESIGEYSARVANSVGLGRKNINDGILVVIAKDDRKIRIELGIGLENKISDSMAKKIIREILSPHLKNNEYFLGIDESLDKLMLLIKDTNSQQEQS